VRQAELTDAVMTGVRGFEAMDAVA
jgi:hypothetical protein